MSEMGKFKFKLRALLMEAAVSAGKVNDPKSKTHSGTPGSGPRSSEAQVGNRSEDAACGMAGERGRTNQDAGARRSLLSQTQLPRVSTSIYLRHRAALARPLRANAEVAVPARRMGTGAWQCLRPMELTAPSALRSVRPSPRLTSHLRGRGRKKETPPPTTSPCIGVKLHNSASPAAPTSGSSGGAESGVFPCWDWII